MRFVLQPCKLRRNRLVSIRGADPVTLDWDGLAARFVAHVPAASPERTTVLQGLRRLRVADYVGLVRPRGEPETSPERRLFVYGSPGHDGDASSILRLDEEWPTRLVEVWRVEEADFEVVRSEASAEGALHVVSAPRSHPDHMVRAVESGG